MASNLIGIDIGTQGTKVVLLSREGKRLAAAFRKSKLHQPAAGVVEEDPEFQLDTVCRGIRACMRGSHASADSVAAIAIDGQMAGVIGVGEDGRNVTPYDSWLDTRCSPYIVRMQKKAGRRVIRMTGGPPSFNHGPKILWWKHERPKVYRRIASFVQPGGYAAMRLCGLTAADAFIDTSYLHFSGFADNRKARWDAGLCKTFGVAKRKLPRIVASHEVVGGLTAAMARRCALRSGTPVVAGCGDTAASFLACGATREGICVDVAGTASVFAATTRRFCADTKHGVLGWGRSATPGLWHPYAYINGGGMNLEWFRSEIAAGAPDLETLNRSAARLKPAVTDPMFVPHLGGRVSPSRPGLRGCWAGLTWNHTDAHLYRSVLEGVALEYAIYRKVLLQLNPDLKMREVRITGGGEKSALWNRIKADVLGVRVVQISGGEGAPMGAALVAGYGVGLFGSLNSAAKRWIKVGKAIRPNRRTAAHYAKRCRAYEQLLEKMENWSLE